VKTRSLKIRGGPGTSYPHIGTLWEGNEISGVEDASGWLKVDSFSIKNQLFPEHQAVTEAWVGRNFVKSCSDTSTPSPEPIVTMTPSPSPISSPTPSPGSSTTATRCTVCVMYRDRHTEQAIALEQALNTAGFWTKTINTDLTEVREPLAPGMVQVVYTEQGATKLDAVLAAIRPLVSEGALVIEPQASPRLGRGDEIQIRLY